MGLAPLSCSFVALMEARLSCPSHCRPPHALNSLAACPWQVDKRELRASLRSRMGLAPLMCNIGTLLEHHVQLWATALHTLRKLACAGG